MSWSEIIGQEKAKELLVEQLQRGKTSHAYLFIGPEGVGKKLTAQTLAQALNCTNERGKPCNECNSCRQILHGNSAYVSYFSANGQKIKIEHIREICKTINLKIEINAQQVIIIDGADTFTSEAANNLLKTLEEPPARTHFILLAEEKAAILPTILSRCQIVLFSSIKEDDIIAYLTQKYQLPHKRIATIAKLAQGSIGNADKIIKDEKFETLREKAQEIFDFVPKDAYDILKLSAQLEENKDQLQDILNMLRLLLRDALVNRVGAGNLVINEDKLEKLIKKDFSVSELLDQYKLVDEALRGLKANANRRLTLDALLLAMKLDGRKYA